jgi:hypothetical protein
MASILAALDRPSAFVTDLQDRIGAFSRQNIEARGTAG